MPAASYREGPDGHSSRKQTEGERVLAFFLSRGALSAVAIFRRGAFRVLGDGAAPRRTRCSPQPRQHSVIADSASCGDASSSPPPR